MFEDLAQLAIEHYNNHSGGELKNELRIIWPNNRKGETDEAFWEYEWHKHGCYSDFGVPLNKKVTEEYAINMIRKQIGVDVQIDTDEYGNVFQVKVATDEYINLIDIPRKITNSRNFPRNIMDW
ncbi:hypothetical protein OROHE_023077 [Orobanche hederae]